MTAGRQQEDALAAATTRFTNANDAVDAPAARTLPPSPSVASPLTGSLAVLHDMREEGWPSMDQMAHLLTTRVPTLAPGLTVAPIQHRLVRLLSRAPLQRVRSAFFADRVLNRMVLYPQRIRWQVRGRYDLYHVVDHSYAQLALELPASATVVSCHDVDTFRSLVTPSEEPRNRAFRAMTRRILRGLRRAAVVVCGSEAARDDLVRFGLADPSRLRVVLNGIDPALFVQPSAGAERRVLGLLPVQPGVTDVLHVGNDIPRKRLDRLLDILAALKVQGRAVRLVRVGSPMRDETRRYARDVARFADIVELPHLDDDALRAVYRRCALLLLTSDREGYGLPVLEAFAAGRPVVASDIPALRETSGGLASLVRPDGVQDWVAAVEQVLSAGDPAGALAEARRAHAASRTWDGHVRGLLPVYAGLLERLRASRSSA